MNTWFRFSGIGLCLMLVFVLGLGVGAYADGFKAGFAKRDITPSKPTPMWGYGARHALLSTGVRDPLFAKVVVIEAGKDRLAIMGLDIGRGPTQVMMANIRKAVKEQAGVAFVLISGSHSHHGPVIELVDEPGKGKGRFDDAVAYVKELETKIIEAIVEASGKLEDARIGWASEEVQMNRNRHTKIEPKPVDRELAVLRFDDLSGKPLAIVVNFAAHPTSIDAMDRRFTSEYPGYMQNAVEAGLSTNCLFMQGASGDLSTDRQGKSMEDYGTAMGEKVVEIAKGIETKAPTKPSIKGAVDSFSYESRMDLHHPMVQALLGQGFFPEMLAMLEEIPGDEIYPEMTTILLNGSLALVGGSGEFFCDHSIRLKARARDVETFFFGYCNGHQMYFPTIEATSEGGYGCDPLVSWVALGAGEEMMNKALIHIYTMMGKYEQVPLPKMTAGAGSRSAE